MLRKVVALLELIIFVFNFYDFSLIFFYDFEVVFFFIFYDFKVVSLIFFLYILQL